MSQHKVSYLKAGIWYTIGNILIKGVSFIALPIFTRLLSTEDFGKYNIFLSYESIVAILLGLGISGTIKIAFFDYKDQFADYFSSVISLTFFFALVVDFLFVPFYIYFIRPSEVTMWSPGMVHFLIFASLGTSIYNLISVKYVINAEYKANLLISFVYTASNILLSILLCYSLFESKRYIARIVGYTLPIMIISFGIALTYVFKSRVIFNKQYWQYAIRLGSPIIIHSLSMILLIQIGKIMINYYCGDADTGIYSVGATISAVLNILMASIDNAWAPWFYRGLDENRFSELLNGNNRLVFLFAAICCCFLLLSPEMIILLTTEEYYDGLYSLVPFLVATFINFMYLFAVNQEYFYKKTKTIAIGTVIATLSAIILNYLLIPIWGYLAAAYVSCISYLILFAIHSFIVNSWGKPKVVSMSYLLSCLILVSLIGIITIYFRSNLFFRCVLLCVMIIPILNYVIKLYKEKNKKLI